MSVNQVMERDAERPAYVRFETRAVDDKAATLEAGHYVSRDEDWALITPPYSKDCVEKKVDKWLSQVRVNVKKGRVPQNHLDIWTQAYDSWKKGQEIPVNGTSIKDWNILSPSQCKNLISAGCLTIEDLAQCNDEGLRRIGMGAVDLKNKAKAWLQAAKDHGPIVMQVTSLLKENEQLKGSIESLQEQITLLARQIDSKENPVAEIDNSIGITDIIEQTPAEQYFEKFGKKPHHLMKEATILKKLKE